MPARGFFGIQDDPADKSMLLMLDYDVFYEFIPMDEFGSDNPTVDADRGRGDWQKLCHAHHHFLRTLALSDRRHGGVYEHQSL